MSPSDEEKHVSSKKNSFRYADVNDIATASLRRGCLRPDVQLPGYANLPGLTNGHPRMQENDATSSSIMTCFDPLQKGPQNAPSNISTVENVDNDQVANDEDGRIILLSSESIPDILQTLDQQQTSLGASPRRDVMALYAKVEKKPAGGVIVNELSHLLHDKAEQKKQTLFDGTSDQETVDEIPAVPRGSYISVANSNVDQNI